MRLILPITSIECWLFWHPSWQNEGLDSLVFCCHSRRKCALPRSFNGQLRWYGTIAGAGAKWKSPPLILRLTDPSRLSADIYSGHTFLEIFISPLEIFVIMGNVYLSRWLCVKWKRNEKIIFIKWVEKPQPPFFREGMPFCSLVHWTFLSVGCITTDACSNKSRLSTLDISWGVLTGK